MFVVEAATGTVILTSEEQERDAQAAACRRGLPRNELARLCIEPFTADLPVRCDVRNAISASGISFKIGLFGFARGARLT
ncbi:MAG: hypothetical protein KIT16_09935, partial [Rhodospirillaceae bacterium]|nr:hypothetical protein [Rhodospirillaceae bacterium]